MTETRHLATPPETFAAPATASVPPAATPTRSLSATPIGATEPTETAAPAPRTAALTRRDRLPMFGLLLAQGLSLAGNAITLIVVPLYVLADTGSVLATGVAGAFATVPVVLGGALGGVLVDRVGFRRAAITGDVASGLTVLAMPVLAATVGLPFWALLALVFVSGIFDTPGNTAKAALLPDVAEAAGVTLTRATSAQSAISRSATMVGASVAAVSVVAFGALNSLLLDAATFAFSAVLLWYCVRRSASADATATDSAASDAAVPATGYWREFTIGVGFVARTPIIRNIVLLVVITNCFDAAGVLVLMPVYANSTGGDGGLFGVMVAVISGGALAGAGLFAWFGHRLNRRAVLVVCFLLAGAPPYAAMTLDVSAPVLLTVFALAGLSAGSINPLLSTVLYEQVPRLMRARVLGALTTGVCLGMPIGSVLGGALVAGAGLVPVLIMTAVAYAAVTLTPLFGRSWRKLG